MAPEDFVRRHEVRITALRYLLRHGKVGTQKSTQCPTTNENLGVKHRAEIHRQEIGLSLYFVRRPPPAASIIQGGGDEPRRSFHPEFIADAASYRYAT